MYKVIEILNQVSSTGSRNEKEAIFKENKDNELLQKVLEYTYNPYKVYGIKEKSLNLDKMIPSSHNINCIFELLDYISKVNINDEIRDRVSSFICSAEDIRIRELYVKMILKDLRLGATTKTINKIWKGLIPEFNVMLSKKFEDRMDKIKGEEIIITTKLDGIRILARKDGDDIKLFTRQGKLLEDCVDIENELWILPDGCYDGELLRVNSNNLNSKDLFQETRKETGKKGIKQGLEFYVFDCLSISEFEQGISESNCLARKFELKEILSNKQLRFIKEVEILEVTKDHSKIREYLDKAIANDEEGIMVNLVTGKYECKRSNSILKVKKFYTMDLEIIGFQEGSGKYKGSLGRINVRYKDNHIVGVGSGFSDVERYEIWSNQEKYLGRIMEVNYFEETQAEDGGLSLRFPTFSCIREEGKEVSYD